MKKRATIYDVAKEADVSITTVSRYLNNPDSVKDETGARIYEAVEKLDYIRQGKCRYKRRTGRRTDRCPDPLLSRTLLCRQIAGYDPDFCRK